MPDELSEMRKKIDEVDEQLIGLLNRRFGIVKDIAVEKQKLGIRVTDAKREQSVLDTAAKKSDPSYAELVKMTYKTIMLVSSVFQEYQSASSDGLPEIMPCEAVKKAGYFGEPGSNTHAAAMKLYPDKELTGFATAGDAADALEKCECGVIVLPAENSTAGSVSGIFDMLVARRLYITKCCRLPIEHCLMTAGAAGCGIKKIYSHPQALRQCKSYLREHYKNAETVPVSSTSYAARLVSEESANTGAAAIAPAVCARLYGLSTVEENIQDINGNSTRFICVSKQCACEEDADKFSISFLLPHKPGTLSDTLNIFNIFGLNISKIESQPDRTGNFEYRFFLDIEGSILDMRIRKLIKILNERTLDFRFLGAYKEV